MMKPDDEIAFLRARDDSRVKFRQIMNLYALRESPPEGAARDPLLTANLKSLPGIIGVFHLHGRTLRRLQERYPSEERIANAIVLWEECCKELESTEFAHVPA